MDGDPGAGGAPCRSSLALLERQPHFVARVGAAGPGLRKLRVTFSVLEELAQLPLEERVRRLRLLAQGYGSRDAPLPAHPLGQEALAQMLGSAARA